MSLLGDLFKPSKKAEPLALVAPPAKASKLPARTIDTPEISDEVRAQVLIYKNTKSLTSLQKLNFLASLCKSLGLNPLTSPFDFIEMNSKETLYARKDCTDQLRKIHSISVSSSEKEIRGTLCIVTTHVTTPSGRTDSATAVIPIGDLNDEALANAMMKCETKSKRRATLSICGLGLLDELEVEDEAAAIAAAEAITNAVGSVEGALKSPNERFGVSKYSKLLKSFSAIGISEEDILQKYAISSMENLSDSQIDELRGWYQKIKARLLTKENFLNGMPDLEADFDSDLNGKRSP